jgi:hypothetical protein
MPNQKTLFYCLFVWCCHSTMAQEVIATSGMFGTHTTGSLSITIGEAITETELNSSGGLTQGFQQNYESILALNENEIEAILLYPNPFASDFFIDGNFTADDEVLIYDLNFRLIARKQLKDCSPCQINIAENTASGYLIYHSQPGKQPRFVGTLIQTLP